MRSDHDIFIVYIYTVFFKDYQENLNDTGRQQVRQTGAALRTAALHPGEDNLVMVSHAVNISALAGVSVASGEIVVVRPGPDGQVSVIGNLGPF